VIPLAHVGGVPVEETLASLGPTVVVALGAMWAQLRAARRRLRARRPSLRAIAGGATPLASMLKPAWRVRRRGAAMVGLAAALLFAPVAWALGELSQKAGTAGCVSETGTGGACRDGKALEQALRVAVSPDGRNLYVASAQSDAVAVFDRDPATGALTQKAGSAGCVSDDGTGGLCRDGTALDGAAAVAVSPDGGSVYAVSAFSDAVAVFDRDPATGALTQKAGSAGCVSDTGSGGACRDGVALDGALGVAASADGKNIYVASQTSGAVAVLDRDQGTGALTQKAGSAGCVSDDGSGGACQGGKALGFANRVAPSRDGTSVYVASLSGEVAVFDRDPATGVLTQKPGTAGCVSEDGSGGACQDGSALDAAADVAVSPDGTSVYVASLLSDAVAILDRDPATGVLTEKPGEAGCVSEDGTGGACQNGSALDGAFGVAASPDGTGVYVASGFSDAVAVFDRDPATGALAQKPGLACVSETGTGACRDGTALDGAGGVAVSPDGSSVYVASQFSNAVAIFDRAAPSQPAPPQPAPSPPPVPSPPPAAPPSDALAPTLTGFRLAPHRFRVAAAATPTTAQAAGRGRTPRGSRLRFTLSEPARARILIERAQPGRRVGGLCKSPTRRLRERPSCTRHQRAGRLTRRDLPAGSNAIPFSGRIGRRALAHGRYRATITATDPAGNRSAPSRATFAVARG
jgi:DNA-binding beta-propeller fold protein YncE